jgi:hypothetical protein
MPLGAARDSLAGKQKCKTPREQQLQDQQWTGRWRNRCLLAMRMGIDLQKFAEDKSKCRKDLAPNNNQIQDYVTKESGKRVNILGNSNLLQAIAEMIHSARMNEEEIVRGILNQWGKGAHGFVPMEKEEDIIQLGCKNMNSLGMYNQKGSKMRRINNLHKQYLMEGTYNLEHGTNFSRLPESKRACDIFSRVLALQVSIAHNINKSISQCQQGRALVEAFGRLARFVQESVDRTSLCRWSWVRVGTGDHSKRIISAYQLCNLTKVRTSTLNTSGKMKKS